MALGDNTGGSQYLNIKEGKITYKDKLTKEKKTCGFVEGTITGVKFEEKEWEGKKYEEMSVNITDGEERYILQMKTDSGYFRAFCNCLRTGDPTKRINITPTYQVEGGSKKSGMFVNQYGKALSWYSTKKDPKDVPPAKAFEIKGSTVWDGTDQIKYWKNWLNSLTWTTEIEAGSLSQPVVSNTPVKEEKVESTDNSNDNDDLPF